jgi:hypothetical protein
MRKQIALALTAPMLAGCASMGFGIDAEQIDPAVNIVSHILGGVTPIPPAFLELALTSFLTVTGIRKVNKWRHAKKIAKKAFDGVSVDNLAENAEPPRG